MLIQVPETVSEEIVQQDDQNQFQQYLLGVNSNEMQEMHTYDYSSYLSRIPGMEGSKSERIAPLESI